MSIMDIDRLNPPWLVDRPWDRPIGTVPKPSEMDLTGSEDDWAGCDNCHPRQDLESRTIKCGLCGMSATCGGHQFDCTECGQGTHTCRDCGGDIDCNHSTIECSECGHEITDIDPGDLDRC